MPLRRDPPVVHWCNELDEYLNIPLEADDEGCRIGTCPYCGEMFEETDAPFERWELRGPEEM